MGSRVVEQVNPWGRQSGREPQRADLWLVNFRAAIAGIDGQVGFADTEREARLPQVGGYYVQSVSFPELKVKADAFRRDSRSYQMPGFDEPLETLRMTLVVDAGEGIDGSHIYQFLDRWRRLVRAGRGALGGEPEISLNSNYRIDYAFNLYAVLLKGGSVAAATASQAQSAANTITPPLTPPQSQSWLGKLFSTKRNTAATVQYPPAQTPAASVEQEKMAALQRALQRSQIQNVDTSFKPTNDLQYSGLYILEKCWLSSFKLADLNYGENKLLTIEAQFYVENILDNATMQ